MIAAAIMNMPNTAAEAINTMKTGIPLSPMITPYIRHRYAIIAKIMATIRT